MLIAAGAPVAASGAAPQRADVSSQLLSQLSGAGSTTGFLVYFKDKADLSPASKLKSSDAKAEFVYKALSSTAEQSQQSLRASLSASNTQYRSYWIANAMWVKGGSALVTSIAAQDNVLRIEPSKTYPLITPTVNPDGAHTTAVEWGLTNIGAPSVWSTFGVRGEGITVANIDTGVQFDHSALVRQYRGNLGSGTFDHNYNWFDPAGICPSPQPCDNNNHGTHTMGTMVGDDGGANQIGVAPNAKWMAAKGCESNNCSDASLLASAQFVLAPTDLAGNNPRPDLHADIVNNSWGGGGGDLWYQASVQAWIAAGMFPSFSNGNSGPGCGTAGSPGDYTESYAAGAYDINNVIAGFSSRGPSAVNGGLKPNVGAPGVNVRSSIPGNSYANFNGTSMAAPHVSGAVALIWSAAPTLKGDIDGTKALLDSTATDVDATSCGGTPADNNIFGEGRLNALAAVTAAPRGPNGRVIGTVTDAANGQPLAGVTVSAGSTSQVTGADGKYSLQLEVGTYTVTASIYGYAPQSATVTVTEGAVVTQNFALVKLPLVTVSGKVTDGSGKAWPLYAKITVGGRPGGPIWTNPATGMYSMSIASSTTYHFTTSVVYPGYRTVEEDVAVGSTNLTHNISVPVDPGCTAKGYTPSFGAPVLTETFDATTVPAGWSVVNRTVNGGWSFNDLGHRGNLTGGAGNFAIIDSDQLGIGKTEDTDLITPVLNLSAVPAPYLRFNMDYRAFSNSTADIDVTTNGGTTWTNIWHQSTTDMRGPRLETIALPGIGGSATAQIRFRYKGTWAWWWEVDNVQVLNRSCDPIPGGLVVGFTTDKNTNTGLNGVSVVSNAVPADRATSAATPDDPNIGDGFYWLFSSVTGATSFTASKAPYQPLTKSVTVVNNDARQLDFPLAAGRLTVTPTTIEGFVPLNATRSTTLKVTNTGSAPADVRLLERAGTFTILGQQGAPLVMQTVPGGLSKAMTGPTGAPSGVLAQPMIDPAWTPIANYPVAIFDNAAAVVGGKVYSVGGASTSGNERKLFVYDPDTNAWTAGPTMPVARAKPQAATIGDKIYVFGGWSAGGVPVTSVDVYDTTAGSWSTISATNPKARSAAGVGVVNGKVYLVGGCTNGSCDTSTDTVIFDPTAGTFSAGASYPQTVGWMTCGGVSGALYCGGGSGDADYNNGFKYDPAADSWSPIANLPLDLWGSQGASASGLLVLAGGVTGNSTAITNRTVAYDPATNTWANLPNAAMALFRGAGACGAYKIGGSIGSFIGNATSEKLGGLGQCEDVSDVPWLSETPDTFTINPGQTKNITVTLSATAAAQVFQPGDYTAQIGIQSNTPYAVPAVDVTMHVTPPATWGKIQGTVLGQGCTGPPVGVPAFIRINLLSNPEIGYSIRADNQGRYAWWLPAGKYQVIVAKDNWVPEAVVVKVERGFVLTQNFMLEPFTPCTNGANRL